MRKGQIYITFPEACEICGLPRTGHSRERLRALGCEVRLSARTLRYDIRRIGTIMERMEAGNAETQPERPKKQAKVLKIARG